MKRALCLLLFAGCGSSPPVIAPIKSCMHSHNDYERARPLFDAIEHGACSIEADVHLVEGSLLLAHEPEDVTPEKTLEALYLEPLATVEGELTLLVDVKSEAESTYAALREVFDRYPGLKDRVALV